MGDAHNHSSRSGLRLEPPFYLHTANQAFDVFEIYMTGQAIRTSLNGFYSCPRYRDDVAPGRHSHQLAVAPALKKAHVAVMGPFLYLRGKAKDSLIVAPDENLVGSMHDLLTISDTC